MSYKTKKKCKIKYPVDWEKVAEATRVTLIPESSFDSNDPHSLFYRGDDNEEPKTTNK